jgi:phosphoribosylanthranilate isomerase
MIKIVTMTGADDSILTGVKCGYAGGIGPDNIREQIIKVNQIVGDVDTWIDMETLIRSINNRSFEG